jgi:hypothetical protein
VKQLLTTIFGIASLASIAVADSPQDFIFYNDTGSTIKSLYVSPHDDTDWGNDVLGSDELASGDNTIVYWESPQAAEYYDLKIIYYNNVSCEFREGYNLLRISRVWMSRGSDRYHTHIEYR